jgi:oligoendopeptidase F
MTKSKRLVILLAALAVVALLAASLPALERADIAVEDTWDLTALYPSLPAAKAARETLLAEAQTLHGFEGKLAQSPQTLKDGLEAFYRMEMEMRRLEAYAGKLADQDTRVAKHKEFKSQVESARTVLGEKASFIDPEIVAMGAPTLEKYLAAEPGLTIYAFPLRETLRKQKHILSPKEERVLAAAGDIADTGYNTFSLLSNADMPYPTVTLSDGAEIKMTYTNFGETRRSLNADDRKLAFETMFGLYDQFKRTIGETLYSQLKTYKFYATMRGYDSTLEMAMDDDAIPTAIYHSLVAAAHENLPTFHRYLKLKARALGKEKLAYYDLYMPFTDRASLKVTYPEAKALLHDGLQPLGKKYVDTIDNAFDSRWVDVYPNEGKDSGAYASGWAYEVHPYVLMNYTGTYSEALTLAHEMGHAMHSYFSNSNQPFPASYYSTFTAEVASTLNENLVNDLMLKRVTNDDERLYLLGNFLDGTIKGTFFRQIHFAEFELMMHQEVAKGEALTGEKLSKMFLELTRMYYGHDQGVVDVPETIAVEWSVVPHFYYNFYVYQYATSIAAASLIAQRILDGEPGALEAYQTQLLQAGGSDHPVAQLQRAGADMTKPEAYAALMKRANRYMDDLEAILDRQGK